MGSNFDESEAIIRGWAVQTNTAVMSFLPLCAPIKDIEAARELKRSVMLLSTACWGTTQTILYLVVGLRLWDAEVLMRSLTEGTIKFGYILERPEAFAARSTEYRVELPAVAKLRWHARAEAAIKAAPPNTPEIELRPFRDLLVPDEELASIRSKYPRELRADLERRWGFTELVEAVSREDGAFGPGARALLHHYSLASHLYHMSYEGVDLPFERDQREPPRRAAIQKAHAAQLLSSCLHLAVLRINVLNHFLGWASAELRDKMGECKPLLEQLNVANDQWSKLEYPDLMET